MIELTYIQKRHSASATHFPQIVKVEHTHRKVYASNVLLYTEIERYWFSIYKYTFTYAREKLTHDILLTSFHITTS